MNKRKGECEGIKVNCSKENCPIYGSLRVYSDGVARVYECEQDGTAFLSMSVKFFHMEDMTTKLMPYLEQCRL
jgi:hypothetical protein